MQLLKLHAFTVPKKVCICMIECVLIKGFKQCHSHSVSVSMNVSWWGVKLVVKTSTLVAARLGWVTSNEVSGSPLPMFVSFWLNY